MIDGKSVLAVIPARGGSKGIPRKNLKLAGGKPLIAWTIEAAKRSRTIDRLILSSEDPEIIDCAKKWGCEAPFVRPAELARDETPGIDPVLHALSQLPPHDYVALLQPTSPLRTTEDIDACVAQCHESSAPACVSVCEVDKSPYWMYTLGARHQLTPILKDGVREAARRQDLPPVYSLNGAVYAARSEWLVRTRGFLGEGTVATIMKAENSLDIDSELDWVVLEAILSNRKGGA